MRRIELSNNDVELFDSDIVPQLVEFFIRHKDAFRQMKIDQGKEFWTRFVISLRTYSTNHGTIKDIPLLRCDKMDAIYDEGFILIHEEFVEGKPNTARNFIMDIIMVAQNQNNFPSVEGKQTRAHDMFFIKESREVFRRFFGSPENLVSYMKVYILSPVLIKFGGAVCVCLKRWLQAAEMDPRDTSYWAPPNTIIKTKVKSFDKMCGSCFDTLVYACFRERVHGDSKGPKHLAWQHGDPRTNDPLNPLYNTGTAGSTDWRDGLSFTDFNSFFQYVQQTCKSHRVIADCDSSHFMGSTTRETNFSKIFIIEATEKRSTAGRLEYLSENARKEQIKIKKAKKISNKGSGAKFQANGQNPSADELPGKDLESDDDCSVLELTSLVPSKEEAVALCEVMHILDEDTGNFEVIITTTPHDMRAADFTDLYTYNTEFPITEKFLINKFDNSLPKNFKWTECGNVAVSFDYTAEEGGKTDKPTNFLLVMKCRDECRLKWLMIYMVDYVNKRKKRDSLGWTLTSDDILVNMLPNLRSTMWEGVCIRIQQGLDTQDLLPDDTGHRPFIRSSRTGRQIYGKNPVHGDTWTKVSDGSLRLIDPSHDNPLALSKLKEMVEKLHYDLTATYRSNRSVLSKHFYAVVSKKILSLTLNFAFRQDAQKCLMMKFSTMCNSAISNLSKVLTENPSVDHVPNCHKAVDECISKLIKIVGQLKKRQSTNDACESPTSAQSSIVEKLFDYCKGMAFRTHFSSEVDTDEEDAACEAVIENLCGSSPPLSSANSACKQSEQIKAGACVQITHNHCTKHSHICNKCQKPKTPSQKHGSVPQPSPVTVKGGVLKKTISSAVSERKDSPPDTGEESSTSNSNNGPDALKRKTHTVSVTLKKESHPLPTSYTSLPSANLKTKTTSSAKNCTTQHGKVQIHVTVKQPPKTENQECTHLVRNGKPSEHKASSWHDAIRGAVGVSSSADKLMALNPLLEKKKGGSKEADNIVNLSGNTNNIEKEIKDDSPAEMLLKNLTDSGDGASHSPKKNKMKGDTTRANKSVFEVDAEVVSEMEQLLDSKMIELGLTNPLDLLTVIQSTADGEMMVNGSVFQTDPAFGKWIARRLGMTIAHGAELVKEQTSPGKKKKRGRRGRSGIAAISVNVLTISNPTDMSTDQEASEGIKKSTDNKDNIDERKPELIAKGEKVDKQKLEDPEPKNVCLEKKIEEALLYTEKKVETKDTKQKQEDTRKKGASLEMKQQSTEEKGKKREGCGKKQEDPEKRQEGKESQTQDQKNNGCEVKAEPQFVKISDSKKITATDNKVENSSRPGFPAREFRSCANCGEEEPKPKAYKKCQKCRTERVENARYYCGRDCQVSDWSERHKEEHRNKSFP